MLDDSYIFIVTNESLSFGLCFETYTSTMAYRPFVELWVFPFFGETILPKGEYRPWNHFSLSVNEMTWQAHATKGYCFERAGPKGP